MDLGLRGKAAAVMAASDGLGRAAAFALAREGARVAICGRTRDKLASAAKEISEETGAEVIPIVADVTKAESVERFVNAAAADLTGLDVLVTNKGGPPPGGFDAFGDGDWQLAFDQVVMSTVRAVRAALPHMRMGGGGGSIVMIESSSVREPIDNLILSNALRPAVMGLMKSLSQELAKDQIRVNAVLPGPFATERHARLMQERADRVGITFDEAVAQKARAVPLQRMGAPLELGEAVAFLSSARASYITGIALPVDGGLLRAW